MMATYVHLKFLCIVSSWRRGDYNAPHSFFESGAQCVDYVFVEVIEGFLVASIGERYGLLGFGHLTVNLPECSVVYFDSDEDGDGVAASVTFRFQSVSAYSVWAGLF